MKASKIINCYCTNQHCILLYKRDKDQFLHVKKHNLSHVHLVKG